MLIGLTIDLVKLINQAVLTLKGPFAGAHPRLQSWGVQFLGLRYDYPSTEKNSIQFGTVGYIITLYSSKSYVKSWGSVYILGVRTSPTPPVVGPMIVWSNFVS